MSAASQKCRQILSGVGVLVPVEPLVREHCKAHLQDIMTELMSDSGGDRARFVDGTGYVELKQWMTENPHWERLLQERGYMVFRNFPIHDTAKFDAVLELLIRPSHEFSEETSPRSSVSA